MRARGIIAALLALAAATAAVANAIVRSQADQPGLAQGLWPGHPLVLRSTAMAGVGEAAGQGRLPSEQTMAQVRQLASRAPLEPEPFLVEAALAQKGGEWRRARELLIAARARDPRSPAARILLADQYVREGDVVAGLVETTVLTRLVPGLADQLAPGLAAYARSPGAIGKLRGLFRQSPDLEPTLLLALASDAANAQLVLAIASRKSLAGEGPWRSKLLAKMVEAGAYAKAYLVWIRLAGLSGPVDGIYRPDFVATTAPPPFNWTLAQSGDGLAEPARGGGLRVLHYGRVETVLASQLVLLGPGRYELSMTVRGEIGSDSQLRWRVRCKPSNALLAELALTAANARRAVARFDVPATACPAQSIELAGMQMDMPTSTEATISPLSLVRAAR